MLENNQIQKERNLYNKKIENDFNTKYKAIEQQLKRSEQERLVLIDSLNRRDIHIQNLLQLNKGYAIQLNQIKGRYDKLTSSEKAKEMERRANGK